jgi:hypothetical protein
MKVSTVAASYCSSARLLEYINGHHPYAKVSTWKRNGKPSRAVIVYAGDYLLKPFP